MEKKVWTAKDVIFIQQLAQDILSLNTKVNKSESGDEDCELGEFIPDNAPGPVEITERNDRTDVFLKIITNCLSPREQSVIINRYGFIDGEPKTLDEVGQMYGVTRERVRQVEAKAIRKLRAYMRRNRLKEVDL